MTFKDFEKDLQEKFEAVEDSDGSCYIYWFVEEGGDEQFKCTFVEDNDETDYDSYGSEDSNLSRIYQMHDYDDCYVEFYGTRRSYAGEEWDGVREVKQQTKTIQVWEEIK